MNTYAYTGDDPINSVDPLGLCPSHKCGTPPQAPPGVSVANNMAAASAIRAGAPFGFTNPAVAATRFYYLVKSGGSLDYYTNYGARYDAFGNFNYGATGTVIGFSPTALLNAVGIQQVLTNPKGGGGIPFIEPPYGDSSFAQAEIKAGIAYAQCINGGN